jgi:hypothetical protein
MLSGGQWIHLLSLGNCSSFALITVSIFRRLGNSGRGASPHLLPQAACCFLPRSRVLKLSYLVHSHLLYPKTCLPFGPSLQLDLVKILFEAGVALLIVATEVVFPVGLEITAPAPSVQGGPMISLTVSGKACPLRVGHIAILTPELLI